METRKISGRKVKLYTSPDDMPYRRFVEFDIYAAIDAGTGSDLAEFDARMVKVYGKLKLGKTEESAEELQNVRQSYQFILSRMSPKMRAFACLVHSIDGKEYNDLSPEGLDIVVRKLSSEKKSILFELADWFKKKIYEEVSQLRDKVNHEQIGFYKILRDQIKAIGREIIEGIDTSEHVQKMELQLVSFGNTPKLFGTSAVEKASRKNYDHLRVAFAKNFNMKIEEMTVREVLSSLKILESMDREAKRKV